MSRLEYKAIHFVFLLSAVFYFSLVSIDNIGGQAGIILPHNLSVYFAASLLIIYIIYSLISEMQFKLSSRFLFSVIISINLMVVGYWQANDLLFVSYAALALFVAILFVFVLEQIEWPIKFWLWLFYALFLLALLQSIIALIQYFDRFSVAYWWINYFPFKIHGGFFGSFQQRNMLSSFIAFGLVLSVFMLLTEQFRQESIKVKWPLYIMGLTGGFVIFGSGSRAGLMALMIGVLFIFLAHRKLLKQQLIPLLVWCALVVFSAMLAYIMKLDDGALIGKFEQVVYGADVRLFLYETGWRLFIENLWFGVGIGNYNQALQEFVVVHQLANDSRIVGLDIGSFRHPHNELLFWLIQVGLIGCLSLLVAIVLVLRNWWQQGQQKFWLYSGLLAPLVIQAMVSYPFILSATHWFLFLLLLFYSVRVEQSTVKFNLPVSALYGMKAIVLAALAIAVYSFYIGLMGAFETYYFKNRLFIYKDYPQQEQVGYFYNASKWGLYDDLVQSNMQNLFLNAKRDNNFYDLKQYLLWFENQSYLPESFVDYANQAKEILQSNGRESLSK